MVDYFEPRVATTAAVVPREACHPSIRNSPNFGSFVTRASPVSPAVCSDASRTLATGGSLSATLQRGYSTVGGTMSSHGGSSCAATPAGSIRVPSPSSSTYPGSCMYTNSRKSSYAFTSSNSRLSSYAFTSSNSSLTGSQFEATVLTLNAGLSNASTASQISRMHSQLSAQPPKNSILTSISTNDFLEDFSSIAPEISPRVTTLPTSTAIREAYEMNLRGRAHMKEQDDLEERESYAGEPSSFRQRSPSRRMRSQPPFHTKEGGAMAARARHRLQRSQSCGECPRRLPAGGPLPGCTMFDHHVYESFKASLCEAKKVEDERCGPLDTSLPPRSKWMHFALPVRESELDNVIPRDTLADWVSSLRDFKAEYDAEERSELSGHSDPWLAPSAREQAIPRERSRSPVGQPRYMKLAMEIPDKTEAIVGALFGPEAQGAREQPGNNQLDHRRYMRQLSLPLFATHKDLFP